MVKATHLVAGFLSDGVEELWQDRVEVVAELELGPQENSDCNVF